VTDAFAKFLAKRRQNAYHPRMIRFFDIADHARLPQRFARENRSVLARL
jgi:hypothetical protein